MGFIASRLTHWSAAVTPFVSGLVLIFLSQLPVNVSDGFLVTPAFPLMAIYFWSLYRPDLMPPAAVFTLGLLHDFMSSSFLGLWSFIYLVTYAFVSGQRTHLLNRVSHRVWFGFGLVMIVATVTAWLFTSIVFSEFLSPGPFLAQAALSILVYPLVGRVLAIFHARLQRDL
jgi:rod shape-determining protein MreD